MNAPEKEDWRNCQKTLDEEKIEALKFKEVFKAFDFTQ
jgi:hypothetical protein